MDQERSRIQEDLRGQIDGEVQCDDLTLQLYSTDASIHYVKPLGVIRPANTSDVVQCINYATEHRLSIHPRGAGSNFVGSALGEGLVLDFSTSMRRVTQVGGDAVQVQSGAVLESVNRVLAETGQLFGPDPINRGISTVGGICALNASGSNWMRYGSAADNVIDLEFVLADGTIINTANNERNLQNILNQLESLGQRRSELITANSPSTKVNNAGYYLPSLIGEDTFESQKSRLARLLCGSEGTLGVITEMLLRTHPVSKHSGVLLLFFNRLETAAKAAVDIIGRDVAACDLLDRRLLSIARDVDTQFSRLIPATTESMLFIDVHAEDASALAMKLDKLIDRFARRKNQAFAWRSATQPQERALFWNIVQGAIPRLYKLKGRRRALPFIDDLVVQPAQLPELLLQTQKRLTEHDVTGSLFAHVGQGILRVYPLLDLSNPEHVESMIALSNDLFDHVISLGGSISGSHGDGYSRTPFLRKQYGRLYEVFGEIKNIFDPRRVLNPGIIVDSPRREFGDLFRPVKVEGAFQSKPEAADEVAVDTTENGNRQTKKTSQVKETLPLLNWDANEMMLATRNCNGCGLCRTTSQTERMCPIFKVLPREEASPRAKANLMRGIISGSLDEVTMKSEEFKAVADLCVNCHQCRLECPANVDIPKLMIEAKAQNTAINGLKMSHWLLTRLDFVYEMAGRFPMLTNWTIRSPLMRWGIDRFFGVAQARKLPRFSRRSFFRWAIRNKLTQPTKGDGKKVLYFVDAYANWNDPELGRATVKVLQHNGFQVYVPVDQLISGMSMISAGLVDRVKKIAARNVEMLAEAVRQGYTIVATEPSAALALQHEYLHFLTDNDAKLVSENTVDITSFLWKLHQQGQMELDFRPLNTVVGYHLPCHLRALKESVAGWQLLNLVPGLRVDKIEKGCSGMAGTYGLIRSNYRRSLRAGIGLINAVRSPQFVAGATECSTCKIQMEQGSTKPTIHPIKILAHSYGVAPELDDLFDRRSEKLMVT